MSSTVTRPGRVTDRVFVPAAFVDRLAHMPARAAAPTVRAVWLRARLAELTDPTMVGTPRGMTALRLATHIQRELSTLPVSRGVG